jgi:hypothetical protein
VCLREGVGVRVRVRVRVRVCVVPSCVLVLGCVKARQRFCSSCVSCIMRA